MIQGGCQDDKKKKGYSKTIGWKLIADSLQRSHRQRLHQQAVADTLVVEYFMGIIRDHLLTNLR
jgi:hypothetical protein